jgi:hypothetical protein
LLHELRTWSDAGQDDDITVVAVRRRFERLADELYSILRDVLGDDRAGQAWETLPRPDDHEGADAWTGSLAGDRQSSAESFRARSGARVERTDPSGAGRIPIMTSLQKRTAETPGAQRISNICAAKRDALVRLALASSSANAAPLR